MINTSTSLLIIKTDPEGDDSEEYRLLPKEEVRVLTPMVDIAIEVKSYAQNEDGVLPELFFTKFNLIDYIKKELRRPEKI